MYEYTCSQQQVLDNVSLLQLETVLKLIKVVASYSSSSSACVLVRGMLVKVS